MIKDEVEVLLVEDDPDDVKLTMRSLAEAHICNRIKVARDGEEALDFLFCQGQHRERDPKYQPKLVLLDLKLPKVDGMQVLERIRQDPRTRTIPVVILTSSRQERDVVQSYSLGVNSYIQKPVDFGQFQSMIKEVGYYWLVVNQSQPEASFQAGTAHESLAR